MNNFIGVIAATFIFFIFLNKSFTKEWQCVQLGWMFAENCAHLNRFTVVWDVYESDTGDMGLVHPFNACSEWSQ